MPGGYLVDDEANFTALESAAAGSASISPSCPRATTPNPDHRLTYRWLARLVRPPGARRAALLFRDPKTVPIARRRILPFDEATAAVETRALASTDPTSSNLNTGDTASTSGFLRVNRGERREAGGRGALCRTFELEITRAS